MAAQAQPDASPAYDAVARPRLQTRRTTESRGDADQSGAEDGGEDLFLNIAEDSAKDAANNAASRSDRVRVGSPFVLVPIFFLVALRCVFYCDIILSTRHIH